MKTVIVLPTYNEKENIKKLIPELQKVFKKIKNRSHLVSAPKGLRVYTFHIQLV